MISAKRRHQYALSVTPDYFTHTLLQCPHMSLWTSWSSLLGMAWHYQCSYSVRKGSVPKKNFRELNFYVYCTSSHYQPSHTQYLFTHNTCTVSYVTAGVVNASILTWWICDHIPVICFLCSSYWRVSECKQHDLSVWKCINILKKQIPEHGSSHFGCKLILTHF